MERANLMTTGEPLGAGVRVLFCAPFRRRSSSLVVDENFAIVDVQAASARDAVDPPVERVRAPAAVESSSAPPDRSCVLSMRFVQRRMERRTMRAPPAIAAGRTHRRLSRSPSHYRSHCPTRVEAQCSSTSSAPLSDADMRSADAA